jgi:hypothetical protein
MPPKVLLTGTSPLRPTAPALAALALGAMLATPAAPQTAADNTLQPAGAETTAATTAPPLPVPPPIQALGTQAGYGDTLVIGPGTRLVLAPEAPADAVRLLDGQPVGTEAWQGGFTPGRHEAAVQSPAAGAATLPFVFDPDPPVVKWEVGEADLLVGHGLDQNVERHRPPRHTLPERDRSVPLLWSPDGRRWLPILPREAAPDDNGFLADWVVASDRPQVFVWALDGGAFGSAAPVAPARLEMVRLWVLDELSAVRDLRLRVRPADDGYSLEMVATDLVGNATTVTWPLGRR